jgi:hypothetical protein
MFHACALALKNLLLESSADISGTKKTKSTSTCIPLLPRSLASLALCAMRTCGMHALERKPSEGKGASFHPEKVQHGPQPRINEAAHATTACLGTDMQKFTVCACLDMMLQCFQDEVVQEEGIALLACLPARIVCEEGGIACLKNVLKQYRGSELVLVSLCASLVPTIWHTHVVCKCLIFVANATRAWHKLSD